MSMWTELKKYAPFAIAGGYAVVYMNKGWNYVVTDIQNTTPEKLMAKWQNFAVAGVALVAIQFVAKAKLPVAVKTMLVVALYFIAGHQIATAIDPPTYSNGSSASVAATRNRYANGGG